jgi:1,4-alpha-glucan branching enzyme
LLGYFTFILHTHLPYVLHHGKWPHGSDWLSEAVAECYIPILEALNRLQAKGLNPRISMDFSPINLEQLSDPSFPEVFIEYLDEKITAAEKDFDYFAEIGEEHMQPLAEYWRGFYSDTKALFTEKYKCDIVAAFKRLQDDGVLDAMTCGATHGYFPLLLRDANIRAQLQTAITTHTKHFGKKPRGIWVPECGYRPTYAWKPPVGPDELRRETKERLGVEELLSEAGLEYFVVDGALTKGGIRVKTFLPYEERLKRLYDESEEIYKVHDPFEPHADRSLAEIYHVRSTTRELPDTQPAVFSRDAVTSAIVWSADMGYPGSPPYLDFHKKHHNSGHRYWAVTGSKVDLADKVQYDPAKIEAMIEQNATHFVSILEEQLKEHYDEYGYEGIIASPFDTELFGHWWFEGPRFIEKVIEKLAVDPDVRVSNCAKALDEVPGPHKTIALPEGSWGEGGGHFVWLNKEVKWTWERIYPLEEDFHQTLKVLRENGAMEDGEIPDDTLKLIMHQAARELLLMEASDWQFVITTKGAIDYSTERFTAHADILEALLDMAVRYMQGHGLTEEDTDLLEDAIIKDRPFETIDLAWWSDKPLISRG